MNKEEAMAGLEAMDIEQRRREQVGSIMFLRAFPALLGASMYAGPEPSRPNRSGGWGTPPKPKVLDNSPDRAKGMKLFEINGMKIWAGSP